MNLDMAALGDAAPFATGDPTICGGCRACLSAVSVLTPAGNNTGTTTPIEKNGSANDEGVYDWTCEYCGEVNNLELDDMEKPTDGQESVDYMLEPAPVVDAAARIGGKTAGDKV